MRFSLTIVLFYVFTSSFGQDTSARYKFPLWKVETSLDFWLAYNLQGNLSDKTGETNLKYLEIGIGKGRYIHHRHGVSGTGVYLSEEILLNGNKRIYGTKIGCFLHTLLAVGFSMVYYTDFKKGNLKLRPKLGVGIGHLGLMVGFNIPTINNKAMPELQRQNTQITIRVGLGIKKKIIKTT